jgi:amino acid adenylation domain-containing protein
MTELPFNEREVSGTRSLVSARGVSSAGGLLPLPGGPREAPASSAQQGLWLAHGLSQDPAVYNSGLAYRVRGALQVNALECAIREIVSRHEILRTEFRFSGETLVQTVLPSPQTVMERIRTAGSEALDALMAERISRPFALDNGPLFRAVLIETGPDDHVFLFVAHHVICDGSSTAVFLRELETFYSAYATGRTPDPGRLQWQFGDYAARERDAVNAGSKAAPLSYWKKKLADAPGRLNWGGPGRGGRLAESGKRSAALDLAEVSGRIRDLARQSEVTPFMIFVTALAVLLHRYSDSTDILIGTPVSGRWYPELANLIGPFVNVLPLRIRMAREVRFRELLAQVRQTCLEAYVNQEVPFEEVVQGLHIPREPDTTSLFQVMLSYQEKSREELALENLCAEGIAIPAVSQFEMTINIFADRGKWSGEIIVGNQATIAESPARFGEHFERVLQSVCENVDTPICDVSVLSNPERELLLSAGVGAPVPHASLCVHELIERQAERTPDSTAIVFEGEQLSYQALNETADALARLLRQRGVGPEVRVALFLSRSLDTITALLGTLKAGGAYLPIDPEYPEERVRFILEDANCPVVLTQKHLRGRFEKIETQIIELDAEGNRTLDSTPEKRLAKPLKNNPAYVIYTSGSSGRPKGVVVTHGNLMSFLAAVEHLVNVNQNDVVFASTTVSFDIAIFELLFPLVRGARIVMDPGGVPDCQRILTQLSDHDVTIMQATPSLWRALLESDIFTQYRLGLAISTGEQLQRSVANGLRKIADRVFNLYGPTETTIWSAGFEIISDIDASGPPIGRPVPNTEAYILDRLLQPLPMGFPGELYIGGDALARGYLNRPDLTAERFIPDPIRSVGGRLYRSGDLACWREDGNLEFLGRADQQIKLRGHRIEPGEIETILVEHENIREAVVLDRQELTGQKRLVAYLVKRQECELSSGTVRTYLKQRLPQHMVPSAFVVMRELPLTPSGKVDRRALPEPDNVRGQEDPYAAPGNPIEEIIVAIWGQVIGRTDVGIDDNFFDLGGHSLLAMQVMARVQETFKLELSLRLLFERPTIRAFAEGIQDYMRTGRPRILPNIRAAERSGRQSLSYAQERLWFLDQLTPGSSLYNVPLAVRLVGKLDEQALEAALREVLKRHEVLRTHFEASMGKPAQIISDATALLMPLIDISSWEPGKRDAEVRRAAEWEAKQPFDLACGPLLRGQLLRTGEREHVLLLTMHHIVSDGWSMTVLMNETAALYAAFREGLSSPLPRLAVQYADYAVWQRDWLQGDVRKEQLEYWKTQLAELPVLQVPTDYPRPANQTYRGASERFALTEGLSKELRELSRREGVTLYMTFVAAFSVLLAQYSGQKDIVVGTDIAGRNEPSLDRLIGFFVNQLVLRTDLTGNPSFRELLKRVRETTLQAYEHQDVPFEMIVKELHPARDLSRSPLFQVKLVVQNAAYEDFRCQGLEIREIEGKHWSAKFDLTLVIGDRKSTLGGMVEYSTDLFAPVTVRRLIAHFEEILGTLVRDPEQRISELRLLNGAEERKILTELNQTRVPPETSECINDLFAVQVERTPDAIAAIFDQSSLSYRELNRRATQLAQYLLRQGIGPETPVALCMERSFDLIISILAVLKAGAVYVPIDPDYPTERIAFIVDDTRAPVLLTQKNLLGRLPSCWSLFICMDSDWPEIESMQACETEVKVDPEQLAYMIYTSGSTGEPKGVCIRHRAVCNLAAGLVEAYQTTEASTMLQFASFSFDAATTEWVISLLVGGRLQLMSPRTPVAGDELADFIHYSGVSVLTLPPSVLGSLSKQRLPTVETLAVAGEACPATLVRQWAEGRRFLNAYGPTEGTVCTTITRPLGTEDRPHIGRPIRNTRIYVLNEYARPVLPGLTGELYIGGEGLARGYWNRPELTAERFVPDGLSGEAGARLYRTGDLVRYRDDTNLEFVGRIDEQMKVRGFRIEPGEIESVLEQHASVQRAVVVPHSDERDNKRLVAYIVCRAAEHLDKDSLRAHASRKLPSYLLPNRYIEIKELPLTINGKIDRNALPEPQNVYDDIAYIAPRNPMEEIVSDIWADVLGKERVGAQDNFFELGGHSLLAVQVLSRLRQLVGVEVEVRRLFETPTVAGLAQAAESGLNLGHPVTPPITRIERDNPLPLSFSQQRLWFLSQLEPASTAYNAPVAVRLRGRLEFEALRKSFNEVVRRHEILRTRFPKLDTEPVQVIEPFEEKNDYLEVLDLKSLSSAVQEEHVRRLIREAAAWKFDLAGKPPVRTCVLQVSEDENIFLLTMHHIISDSWSMEILVRELATRYEVFLSGGVSSLPDPPIQYADYAVWQRKSLAGPAFLNQISYWRAKLNDVPSLELPTGRPSSPSPTNAGATYGFTVTEDILSSLRALSQTEGVTLFMVILAAFNAILQRYSGQKDITVGTPISGRNRYELESLVGLVLNTIVVRTDLTGNPSFRKLLQRVRTAALEAYAHGDVPFERVVEEVRPDRDLSRTPLFQVQLVVQHASERSWKLPGLDVSLEQTGTTGAKFDLTMFLTQNGGRFQGAVEYNTDRFEEAFIQRLAADFVNILRAAAANLDLSISELCLAAAIVPPQLSLLWSNSTKPHPKEQCVHHLFEEQAERTPDAVAVSVSHEQVTYRILNEKSNGLKTHLLEMGIKAGSKVGLCLERSIDMMIALLAVIKAGGVYVPLDPAYPKERLAFMIDDADVRLVIDHRHLSGSLPDETPIVHMEEIDWHRATGATSPVQISPEHLLYVLYTSGSTGRPKGVAMSHRAIVNLTAWHCENLIGAARTLQFASLGFDASIHEILAAWSSGGTLFLISEDLRRDSSALTRFIADMRIEKAILPVVVLDQVAQEFNRRSYPLSDLREIMVTGEQLWISPAVRELLKGAPQCHLHNHYGPTEAHVVTSYTVTGDAAQWSTYPPIGKPIWNTQIQILDKEMELLPRGVRGELYIGGEALAQGYLGRPDITAERFLPNPSGAPGSRLYRTGDLAICREDGEIEFLGRLDDQVKIRGHRVEPGEIEAILGQHAHVEQVVVTVRDKDRRGKRLVAYVTGRHDAKPEPLELRSYLRERVPEYMVPSFFVVLEKFPLTQNGKVDRRSLPDPAPMSERVDDDAQPRTPVEELICGIWADVLQAPRVGVYDNFFEVGGHSLLAMQAMTRMQEALGREFPLRLLFERPTVKGLAEGVQESFRAGAGTLPPRISPAKRQEDPLPLSYAQERLWFLDHLAPGNPFYNVPLAVRLSGQLDRQALEASLSEVLERHEVLRTHFAVSGGVPRQVISPVEKLAIPLTDLGGLESDKRPRELERLVYEETHRAFDLARGPLLRAKLIRMNNEEHVFLLTMHHIVSDGWSLGILAEELAALYEAYHEGRPSTLRKSSVQYADYAIWQREWLRGEVLEEQLRYWKAKLAELPTLRLPADHPRPAVQSYRGASKHFELSEELSAKLRELSRREGATVYMALLAAFYVLLAYYTGQDDIVVGTVLANRSCVETERLIGFFANTLAVRQRIDGDPTFREFLRQVRETTLEAYQHQDVPFELLVKELQPHRDPSRSPLFQVAFVTQNVPSARLKLGAVVGEILDIDSPVAKFDLLVVVSESAGSMQVEFNYSCELFKEQTIQRIGSHFLTLLDKIAANPQVRVSDVRLLDQSEDEQILREWNRTEGFYPTGCVHEVFENRAAAAPDAVALIYDGLELSYGELNRRADRVATELASRLIETENVVGICMRRSFEMIIGLLGILKAGAAYLPLDPSYQPEHLQHLVDAAGARMVLTTDDFDRARMKNVEFLSVNAFSPEQAGEMRSAPSRARQDTLAYVTFTSGSTGQPKAVAITHKGILRLLFNQEYARTGPGEVFLQLAPFSFDASTFELWGALLHGGRCVLFPGKVPARAELETVIRNNQVTVVWLTASLFNTVIDEGGEVLQGLRQILTGGEALSVPHVRRALELLPGVVLTNGYGPTESTTFTCTFRVPQTVPATAASIPIGHPIGNTRVYVLNRYGQPVPIGVIGELHIGGDGLARGYWNRPDWTAERFVPDALSGQPGGRLYRSGDLVRWRDDGNLEFVGRMDDQVKLHGFRIEPGEIESILEQHETVRQAVVVLREDRNGHRCLVSYVVPRDGQLIVEEHLRTYLASKLPNYMVPRWCVALNSMPLKPNGKVDRNALPCPQERSSLGQFVGPRTELENVIAGAWHDVLGRNQIGVHDNFFECGGDSLLIIRLHDKLRNALGRDLEIVQLFQFPTIEALARFWERGQGPPNPDGEEWRSRKKEEVIRHLKKVRTA